MVKFEHWEYLKSVLKKAKEEEKGVQLMSTDAVLGEISKIDKYEESYGNFVVYESDDKALMFNAADILVVDFSEGPLILRMKLGIISPYLGTS
jgi:hypothetical protein